MRGQTAGEIRSVTRSATIPGPALSSAVVESAAFNTSCRTAGFAARVLCLPAGKRRQARWSLIERQTPSPGGAERVLHALCCALPLRVRFPISRYKTSVNAPHGRSTGAAPAYLLLGCELQQTATMIWQTRRVR